MDIHNLVHMANRIGDFYATLADRDEALQEVASHLRKYWEPRMRRSLLQQLDQAGTADLHPLVREAVERYREGLAPQLA